MDHREALERLHRPRPDFVSVRSLLALFEGPSATELSRAQRDAWQAKPGDTRHADRVVALIGDAPAPYLRFLIAEMYEYVGAYEEALASTTRAAAETPCWDPMLVAWSYNGIAGLLGLLGRHDEARAVLGELWPYDPFYPNSHETARSVGASLPPADVAPRGSADSLRLSLAHQMYESNREAGFRATAMAMSFVWEGQHAAAASLAELGATLPGPNPAWPLAIAEYARNASRSAPGTLAPLPKGSVAKRIQAVRRARKSADLATLETAAHDPELAVVLEAWAGLLETGHRAEELSALMRELVDVSRGPNGQTFLSSRIEEVWRAAPLPAISATELVERVIAEVRAGALVALPLEPVEPTAPVPPSLAAWLRFGGLDELEPSSVLELARRAFGPTFDALPAKVAAYPALPLLLPETVNERLEVLLLVHANDAGEPPVLALDVSEDPTVEVAAESFAHWLAADVGLTRLRANDATKRAAKAALGKAKLKL